MHHFFVPPEAIDYPGKTVLFSDENAHHISRSLRLTVGDVVSVSDGQCKYGCRLDAFSADKVSGTLLDPMPSTESSCHITLFQALPKQDKMDTIIQKAVEIGVSEIIPVETAFCIMKIKRDDIEKKQIRHQKIALEAAKQCGRVIVPRVLPALPCFDDAAGQADAFDLAVFCYECEEQRTLSGILKDFKNKQAGNEHRPRIAVFVGSEGGFSTEEAKRAREAGFLPCSLGPRILRTETASGFVLSCICYEFELDGQPSR